MPIRIWNTDISYLFDLSDEDAIRIALKEIYSLKIVIDILVNNAGILNTDGLLRLKMEDAHRVMQVNYFAPLQITQGIVKLMLRSKSASIINVASIAALKPTVGNTVYGASKAALISMTTCWAKELASAKIRVNAVAPGYLDTDMSTSVDSKVMGQLVNDTSLKDWVLWRKWLKSFHFLPVMIRHILTVKL